MEDDAVSLHRRIHMPLVREGTGKWGNGALQENHGITWGKGRGRGKLEGVEPGGKWV